MAQSKPVVRYLAPALKPLVDAFTCSTSTGAELRRFLREGALLEQARNISTTYVFLPPDEGRIDGYATVSATGIKAPPKYRELFPDRHVIPAVMIDYLAVCDQVRGQGLGLRIFKWIESRVYPLNAYFGVRFVALDVFASDWRAYQQYAGEGWGFVALPLREDRARKEESKDPPDPKGTKPEWLRDDRLIPMMYDLVDHNGPYEAAGQPE